MSPAEPLPAVDEVLAQCAEALRLGQRARSQSLLAEYPQFAAEIREFLDDFEFVDGRFAPLRELSGGTPGSAAEMPTLGHQDTAVAPPRVGSSFGDYDLLAEVARGGMGVVYKARQRSLNRIVALKMVLGGKRDSSLERDRFLVEARAVARLNHPQIVPIYEVGEHQGTPYFTMEFFTGGSLRDRIEELRGDQRAAAGLMVTIARAVEHAHRRGILHRDLKPTNVLLDERRQPHVADFGLAKQLDEESDLTQAGAIVGTPSYMAPEQANAQTDLTTAVDVYGLGALMYELLTGRPPFKGNTPLETMMAAVSQEPVRPRKLARQIDADLETICLKCLSKDPLARYGSADALADDLERWTEGKPIMARPATRIEQLTKWSRRQPLLAGSLATVAIAVLGLLILAGFLWQNAELRAKAVQSLDKAKGELADVDAKRQQAEQKKTRAETLAAEQAKLAAEQAKLADAQKALADKFTAEVKQLEQAASAAEQQLAAARSEARSTLYAADMQLAHTAWLGENLSTAADLVGRYADPAGGNDLRGFEWHYLMRQLNAARLSWRDTPEEKNSLGSIVGMAISPDGKTLATAQMGNRLKLWNLADGKLLRSIETKKSDIQGMSSTNITGLFFEDEGRRLVAVARKGFNMAQIDKSVGTAMSSKIPFKIDSLVDALEFQSQSLSDGGPLTVEKFDPARARNALLPIMSGSMFLVDEGQLLMAISIDYSQDGRFVAFAGTETKVAGGQFQNPGRLSGGRLIVWDLKQSKIHAQQTSPTPITAVAFSPAGDSLAIGTSDGAVGLGAVDLAQPPRRLLAHQGFVYSLKFSGDGTRLASGALDGMVLLWDVATAKETARLRGHTSPATRIEITPDGRTLVSGAMDGSVKVWDLERSSEALVLRGHETSVGSLAFTGQGSDLTSFDLDGELKLWRLADGRMLHSSKPAKFEALTVRLSNTGKSLVWKVGIDNGLMIRDVASGKETRLVWNDHVPFLPTFSPDDRYLAACDLHGKGLCLWSVADGKLLSTLDEPQGTASGLTFSTDNKLLVGPHGSGVVLWTWQAATDPTLPSRRLITRIVEKNNECTTAVAFSPDNRQIAAAVAGKWPVETTVRIWDLAADELRAECHGAGQIVQFLAYSPDGRRLATGGTTSGQRGVLKLWDTMSGREVFSAPLPVATLTALAFSPDGQRLLAAVSPSDLTAALTGRKIPGEIHVWNATPTTAGQ